MVTNTFVDWHWTADILVSEQPALAAESQLTNTTTNIGALYDSWTAFIQETTEEPGVNFLFQQYFSKIIQNRK